MSPAEREHLGWLTEAYARIARSLLLLERIEHTREADGPGAEDWARTLTADLRRELARAGEALASVDARVEHGRVVVDAAEVPRAAE